MSNTHPQIDPITGIRIINANWRPSIRYLLRRNRILDLLKNKPIGQLVEIGCGSGALLTELASMGFICKGIETSQHALDIAKNITQTFSPSPQIFNSIRSAWENSQDYVLSLDVLEHIKSDKAALLEWKSLLKKEGILILSVPAHVRKWGAGDIWAGHYRRYEKASLENLLINCGFTIQHTECYGFPVANMTEKIGNYYYKKQLNREPQHKKNATGESGINRDAYKKISPTINTWLGKKLLKLSFHLQNLTLSKDIGSGYIIIAKKQ